MLTPLLQRMHRQIYEAGVIHSFSLPLSHTHKYVCHVYLINYLLLPVRNKECPACRMHCASRRSLRDDLLFDKLINSLFPDLELYEKEVPLS